MKTVEEYHEQALEQLDLSGTGNDMRHRTHQIERAAVLAELAKTAEYAEADPIGPVASVTELRPEVEGELKPVPEATHHFITPETLRKIADWADANQGETYCHGGLVFERRRQYGDGIYMSWLR